MNSDDAYDVYTREPEAMTVGRLNQVVKMLREELYQSKLAQQKLMQDLIKVMRGGPDDFL